MDKPNDSNSSNGKKSSYEFDPTVGSGHMFTAGSKAENTPAGETVSSGPQENTGASSLAQTLFRLHGEYGRGAGARITLSETGTQKVAEDWVREAQRMFDVQSILSFEQRSTLTQIPTFHGRLLIIGLSFLEPSLRTQLEDVGIWNILIEELREPIEEILSEEGKILYFNQNKNQFSPQEISATDLKDTVPNWQDDPLKDPKDDLLGRGAFARYLAKRIDSIPDDPKSTGAYAMHIYGPWGAGKSTLLNFLRAELEKIAIAVKGKREVKKWLIVEFNAWREQHIQPPLWSLLDHIYKTTKTKLSMWNKLREFWWRLNTGRFHLIVLLIVLAWILVLFVLPFLPSFVQGQEGATKGPQVWGANADALSKVVALVTTIWGIIVGARQSLFFGASRAAKNYSELVDDPTNKIRERFNDLIERLLPYRVAVFIDDLDRCQSSYVVDLLEGIQTLFRQAPVVFIVAADRTWLNACYEDVYDKLQQRVQEPGKHLGTLFLEKAFRFSTSMPGIPDELKKSYWQYLLYLKADHSIKTEIDDAREEAKTKVSTTKNEAEVRDLVKDSAKLSFPEKRATIEEAVVHLASPEIVERIEHTLKPYAHLLEPNPRAMKLLVNGYSANRALAILSEVEIDLHQLALWTILSSRWPKLTEYLIEHLDGSSPKIPVDLLALVEDPSVKEIIVGDVEHKPLTVETLKRCAQIRS